MCGSTWHEIEACTLCVKAEYLRKGWRQAESEAAYSAAVCGCVRRHLARRMRSASARSVLPAVQAFLGAVPLPFLGLVLARAVRPCDAWALTLDLWGPGVSLRCGATVLAAAPQRSARSTRRCRELVAVPLQVPCCGLPAKRPCNWRCTWDADGEATRLILYAGACQDDAAGALAQWGARLRFFVYEAVGRLRIDQVGACCSPLP